MPLTTKNWKWHEHERAADACAKGSVRTLKVGPSTMVRVCCPKGHWSGKRCNTSMRSVAVARKR